MDKIKQPEKRLLTDTVELCLKNKIKMVFHPKAAIKGYGGWVVNDEFVCCFDPNEAPDNSAWSVFVHESCHVDQLLDPNSIWHDAALKTDVDWLAEHTNGKTRKSKNIETYFKKVLELEIDCEKRAVEKIKKYKLNMDIIDYIKKGNVYLFSYYSFYHLKCWYNSNMVVYDDPELIKQMPKKYLTVNDYWVKNDLIYKYLKNNNNR